MKRNRPSLALRMMEETEGAGSDDVDCIRDNVCYQCPRLPSGRLLSAYVAPGSARWDSCEIRHPSHICQIAAKDQGHFTCYMVLADSSPRMHVGHVHRDVPREMMSSPGLAYDILDDAYNRFIWLAQGFSLSTWSGLGLQLIVPIIPKHPASKTALPNHIEFGLSLQYRTDMKFDIFNCRHIPIIDSS